MDICVRCDVDNKIDYVWFDTGLEYQATKDHLKYLEEKYGVNISVEDASYFVFHEHGHDLNSEYGEVTHQYPDPNMQERITYISEDKGVLKFKGEAINKGKVSREYEIRFRVFRKNK